MRVGENLEGTALDQSGGFFLHCTIGLRSIDAGFIGETETPFQHIGAVKPPDRCTRAREFPRGAHCRAFFPPVADTGGRIIEEDHELIEIGWIGLGGVLEAMQKGACPGNGIGGRLGAWSFHGCDFTASFKKAVTLHRLRRFDGLKSSWGFLRGQSVIVGRVSTMVAPLTGVLLLEDSSGGVTSCELNHRLILCQASGLSDRKQRFAEVSSSPGHPECLGACSGVLYASQHEEKRRNRSFDKLRMTEGKRFLFARNGSSEPRQNTRTRGVARATRES
jgi:hypothetical protein